MGRSHFSEHDALLFSHLCETGIVEKSVLDELVEVQRTHWKSFGRVAVERGFMRVVQVAKVLSYQAEHPGQPFGEVARDLGILRTSEIQEILELQKALIPALAEVLVDEMVLEPGEVTELLYATMAKKKDGEK